MNKDEALKMAIEALEWANQVSHSLDRYDWVIQACKEALAKSSQEPVAMYENGNVNWINTPKDNSPLYTHPAPSCQECENLKHDLDGYMEANKELINREWQGLRDDDMSIIFDKFDWKEVEIAGEHLDLFKFARAIEQELKTKNGFSDVKEKNHE